MSIRTRLASTTIAVAGLTMTALLPVTGTNAAGPPAEGTAVSGVTLRWGLSNESNNAGFAPGTHNFLSAGRIGDPGEGGQQVAAKSAGKKWNNGKRAGWSSRAGNVAILKNGRSATWGGLSTDTAGKKITSPTGGRFSGHQIELAAGEGWVDRADGRAKIRWDGDFTVLYYSGMTFFYVSDPELNVAADGSAQLTATLGGFGSSMDDLSVWKPLRESRVVMADLDGVDLSDGTVRVKPSYEGVCLQVGGTGVPQVRSGRHWGSWPESFVAYQQKTGQGPYWYSSGGQTDAYKVALPISVNATFGDARTVPAGDPHDASLPNGADRASGRCGGGGDDNGNGNDTDPDNGGNDNGNDGDQDDGGDGNDDGNGNNGGGPREVTDAQLRWGINNESNNRGFAPNTYNFFSAGRIADPGRGGQTIGRGGWSAKDGDVTIEKRQADGSYDTATWQGLSTTPTGSKIASPTDESFSNHQVVIDGGEGTIDRKRQRARIDWDGDFTVLYYSGMTFFYVSDPTLVVRDGRGVVTATLGGFGTERDDMTTWKPLPDKRVTLADLGRVNLGKAGFEARPAYRGVRYSAPPQISAQQRGSAFGAFPKSFVDYQVRTGQASYWYSSGGQTDTYKVPLPMAISYDAERAVDPPDDETPPPDDDGDPTDEPPDTLPTPDPDDDPEPETTSDDSAGNATAEDTSVAASPLSSTYAADQPDVREASARTPDRAWMWWLGGGLLAAATALTLTTSLLTQHRTNPRGKP